MLKSRLTTVVLCLVLTAFVASSAHAQWTEVDLCAVPDDTVMSDQWRDIGILFDARGPSPVVPEMETFGGGDCHLFFEPDINGAVAIMTFVEPGTTTDTTAQAFRLAAYYNPGENAQLVGLDASDAVVAQASITPSDIGGSSRTLEMEIYGEFTTVEWRTDGDPGIAANGIWFSLQGVNVPTLSGWAMVVFSMLIAAGAFLALRR